MKNINNKGFSAVESLIIIVVIGLIGGVGWLVWQNQSKSKNTEQQQSSTSYLSLKDLVDAVDSKVFSEVKQVQTIDSDHYGYYTQIHYQPEGFEFKTTVDSKHYLNYGPTDPAPWKDDHPHEAAIEKDKQTLAPVNKIITDLLSENGFKIVADYQAPKLLGDGLALYEREADICLVNHLSEAGVSCAEKSDFVQAAEKVKPFVDVYKTAKGPLVYPIDELAFQFDSTGSGNTEDDKYGVMYTTADAVYFYQEDGEWVYFTSTVEGLDCELTFSNPKAKAAFSKVCRQPGELY